MKYWSCSLMTKNYNGIFISIGDYWKGIYFNFPKLTIRIYLWGIDWYSTNVCKLGLQKKKK